MTCSREILATVGLGLGLGVVVGGSVSKTTENRSRLLIARQWLALCHTKDLREILIAVLDTYVICHG